MTKLNSSDPEKSRKSLWLGLALILVIAAGSFFFDYGTLFRGFLGTEEQEKVLFGKEMEKMKDFVVAPEGTEFASQPIKTGNETKFEIQKTGKGTNYVGFLSDKQAGSWRLVKADFVAQKNANVPLEVSVTDGSYAKFFSQAAEIAEVCVNYGDGSSIKCGKAGKTFNHEYTAPGEYSILLEAKDPDGRSDRAEQKFVVEAPAVPIDPVPPVVPTVDAQACKAIITGNTVKFEDQSIYSQPFNSAEWTWRWYFDFDNDQATIGSNEQNPTYTYPEPTAPTAYKAYFEVKNKNDGNIADNNFCEVIIEPEGWVAPAVKAAYSCRVVEQGKNSEVKDTTTVTFVDESTVTGSDSPVSDVTLYSNGVKHGTFQTINEPSQQFVFLNSDKIRYEAKTPVGHVDTIDVDITKCAAYVAPTAAIDPAPAPVPAPEESAFMPAFDGSFADDFFVPYYTDPKAQPAPVIDDTLKASFRLTGFETSSVPNTTIAVFMESSTSTPPTSNNPMGANDLITKWAWTTGKAGTQFMDPTANTYGKSQYKKEVKIQYPVEAADYEAEVSLIVYSDKGQSQPHKAKITVPGAIVGGAAVFPDSSFSIIDSGSLSPSGTIDNFFDAGGNFGGLSTFGAYLGADATGAAKTIDDFDYFIAGSGATVYFEAACTAGEGMIHIVPLSESDEGKAYEELVVAAANLPAAEASIANLNITEDVNIKCPDKEPAGDPVDGGQVSDIKIACSVTPEIGYVNETTFLASGEGTAGSISGGYWDFNDGDTSENNNSKSEVEFNKATPPITDAKHIYTKEGVYPVTLSVKDANTNEIFTCEKSVRVNPKPVVDEGNDQPDGEKPADTLQASCSVEPVEGFVNETKFVFTGDKSTGPITDVNWDFGDRTFGTDLNLDHIFTEKGVHTVKLWLGNKENYEQKSCVLFVRVMDKGENLTHGEPEWDESKEDQDEPDTDKTRCSDGIDNDGDLYIDAKDPGCDNAQDDDETDGNKVNIKAECSDGIDNDGDKYIDFGVDGGCDTPDDNDEYNAPLRKEPACSDEIDNDKDGLIDLKDPGCEDSKDNDETNAEEKLKAGGAQLPYCLKPVNPKIYVDLGEVENKAVVHEESSAGYDGKDKDFVGDPIFEGYDDKGDRVFRPFAPIGRDEAVKTALLTTCYMDHLIKEDELSKKPIPFEDETFKNKDYWAKDLIYIGANSGLLEKKDKFHPHDQVTRAEFLKLLLEIYTDINDTKVPECSSKTKIDFIDVDQKDWFCGYAIYAKQLGISVGFKDSKGNLRLNPNKVLTRIDAAIMLWNYYVSTTEKKSFLDVEEPIKKPVLR